MGVIGGSPAAVSAASAAVRASKTKPEQSTPRPTRCMNARRVSAVGGQVAFSSPPVDGPLHRRLQLLGRCPCRPAPHSAAPLNQGADAAPSSACEPPAAPPSPESAVDEVGRGEADRAGGRARPGPRRPPGPRGPRRRARGPGRAASAAGTVTVRFSVGGECLVDRVADDRVAIGRRRCRRRRRARTRRRAPRPGRRERRGGGGVARGAHARRARRARGADVAAGIRRGAGDRGRAAGPRDRPRRSGSGEP